MLQRPYNHCVLGMFIFVYLFTCLVLKYINNFFMSTIYMMGNEAKTFEAEVTHSLLTEKMSIFFLSITPKVSYDLLQPLFS